tara:strand:+ start:6889 stop:7362 length:474 start_codon:yes stop_codon:yes gene_type:complete
MRTPKQISIETFVDNGKLIKNRDIIQDAISQFEGKEITILLKRFFKKRSDNQNRYYWGVLIEHWRNLLREEWGEILSPEEVHEFLKTNLNYEEFADPETGEILFNEITGSPIRRPKSTKENTTFSQEEYHEAIRQLAFNMFGAEIPLPDAKLKANFH